MCLATTTNTPSISTSCLDCYKILIPVGGKLITPYRDFSFPLGKVVTDKAEAPEPIAFGDIYIIEQGYFHAFDQLEPAKKLQAKLQRKLNSKNKKVKVSIFKAIIPSNTLYFKNKYGDICSKSLKIIEEYFD